MADGDLFLLAIEEDDGGYVPGPPDQTPPPMGSCGAELYAACVPLAGEDPGNGWALAHLCEAMGRMRQTVSDLVRDSDAGPGWSLATDVTRAPGTPTVVGDIDLLPFLAQLVGVRLAAGLNDADRRAAIREREGFWRGRPSALVSFASRYTDGADGAVRLRERYDPAAGAGVDAPYHGRVIVKRSRLLPGVDETDLRRRVLARVPAGLIYDVVITDELDYDDVRERFVDYADVARRNANYDTLLGG